MGMEDVPIIPTLSTPLPNYT